MAISRTHRAARQCLLGVLCLVLHGSSLDQRVARAQTSEQAAQPDATDAAATREPRKKKKKKKNGKTKRRDRAGHAARPDGVVVGARVSSFGGAMVGATTRQDKAALLGLEGEIVPKLVVRGFKLSLPLLVAHTETLGADLDESRAAAALRGDYRLARELRLHGQVGLVLVDRPRWPDLYQPSGSRLLRTNRYSHWDRRAAGGLTWHPVRRHWVRADYDYTLSDHTTDPNFEAVARPNHLTPLDGLEHAGALSYRFAGRDLKLDVGVEGYSRESFFVYARDAHTGKTHAGPGGPASNPLQTLRGLVPELQLELEGWQDRLSLKLRYRHELQEDTFQGYYSRSGPHPRLSVSCAATPRLTLRATADASWQRYGANSYRLGPGHPALDSGDRRWDRRYEVALGARLHVAKRTSLVLDGSYVVRDTNFPNYRPGVFPVSSRRVLGYDIDWDYENLLVTIGVEAQNEWM